MFELKSLSEISSRITDGSHFSPTPQSYGYPIANVKDMRDRHIDIDSCTRIKEDDYRALTANGCIIKNGAILLSKDGTIGKVIVYAQSAEIAALSSICIINPNSTANPRYLGHVLRSSICARQYENLMSGSALRRLVLRDIKNIQVPLPETFEQKSIAAILDALDDAIEQSEALIAKLKQVRAGMLHDLLTCGVDENGKVRDPAMYPLQFKNSAIGLIPNSWLVQQLSYCVASLDAGVSVNADDRPHGSGEIGVLKTSALTDGKFHPEQNKTVIASERVLVKEPVLGNSILVSRMNTPQLVGESCYVEAEWPTLFLPDRIWQLKIHSQDALHIRWLSYVLKTPYFRRYVEVHATGTSGSMKNLPKEKLLCMPVAFPEYAEQEEISLRIKAVDVQIDVEEAGLEKLRKQKTGLSADLLTGQVRVPPDLELP